MSGNGIAYGVANGHVVARTPSGIVDLPALATDTGALPGRSEWWQRPTLNTFLAAGRAAWEDVTAALRGLASGDDDEHWLLDERRLVLRLPVDVGDYVDFYASEQHATNLGRLLRPGQPPLLPNWHHLPVGYHGRAGTIVVSGTDVRRPCGQRLDPATKKPVFGPTQRLDVEVEVGYVVGTPSRHGEPVDIEAFADHVFGVVLVNDWSARDIQAWEAQPLGPFLGKSFATSVSAWVTPLCELDGARIPVGSTGADLLPYLRETEPRGLDLDLELSVDGEVVSRPPYRSMWWSPAQLLAHLTVNGASVRTGDLFASGTVSGDADDEVGSLFERYAGERFLDDGAEVVITGSARGADGSRTELGEVRGRVLPASL